MSSNGTRTVAWIPVPLRLGVGVIMTVHGLGKLGIGPAATEQGLADFVTLLATNDVVVPSVVAIVVTLVELFGGLLLLVGLFVRYVAVLIAVDMLAATLLVHLPNGFVVSEGGYEFTVLLALVSISLVLSGPGTLSLQRVLFGDESLPTPTASGDEPST